jgi:hypothetical protein
MPERMQPGVFQLAVGIEQGGAASGGLQGVHDVLVADDPAAEARERQLKLALRAFELPFPQGTVR